MTLQGPEREVHAIVYPPHNPDFVAPDGELPPFVAFVHGGPTGQAVPTVVHANGLIGYFTSRGIGVVDVNYGGSTGYGREYRNRLRGQWGVVDVEDTVAAVRGLAEAGIADPARLGIEGGSAGGWTVLAALTTSDAFACGVSLFGVAELTNFVKDTHDFESRYVDGLVGPLPEAAELYEERAPAEPRGRAVLPGAAAAGPRRPDRAAVPGRAVPRRARSARGSRTPTAPTRASRTGSASGRRWSTSTSRRCRSTARCSASTRPASRASNCREPRVNLADVVEDGWAKALAPVAGQISAMGDFLRAEVAAGRTYLPAGKNILRAFTQPFADVRVLIVGQDPYPTPGHPVGLSFSVEPDVRPVPRSLQNIYKELNSDLGLPTPSNGDLTPWAEHGVLLLNRCLTVAPGRPASHRGKGWELGHRPGDPRARRARRAAGGDPLGPRRPIAGPAARRHPADRVGPPVPAVGGQRVLRLAPVQPGQRRAARPRAPNRSTGRSPDAVPPVLPGPNGTGLGNCRSVDRRLRRATTGEASGEAGGEAAGGDRAPALAG